VTVGDGALLDALSGSWSERAVGLRRRSSIYSTSHAIEDVDVELADGTAVHLTLKDFSPERMLDGARRYRPVGMYDARREVDMYRLVLPAVDGPPRCYASAAPALGEPGWLLLEKVPGVELYQVGDLATWQSAAAWLGRFHAQTAASTAEWVTSIPTLFRFDPAYFRRWPSRVRALGPERLGAHWGAIEAVAASYDDVVGALEALPQALLHGEFYASNVLVVDGAVGVRVAPVDWEFAGIGPGLLDLAALTMGGWDDDEWRPLALAYRAAVAGDDVTPDRDFLEGVQFCRLHLCLQWLGWHRDWKPPSDHAHDWAGIAARIAETLGLVAA